MDGKAFKLKLYESFQQSGIDQSLKAQLRLQLIQLFQKKSGVNYKNDSDGSLFISAINSIIVDHLQHQNYQYSLSVLLPECGLPSHQLLKRDDIVKVLRLNRLIRNQNVEDTRSSLLLQSFGQLIKMDTSSSDKEIQTDPRDTLDKKLKTLDEELILRTETERIIPFKTMEERLVKLQYEYEEKYKRELEEKVFLLFQF